MQTGGNVQDFLAGSKTAEDADNQPGGETKLRVMWLFLFIMFFQLLISSVRPC